MTKINGFRNCIPKLKFLQHNDCKYISVYQYLYQYIASYSYRHVLQNLGSILYPCKLLSCVLCPNLLKYLVLACSKTTFFAFEFILHKGVGLLEYVNLWLIKILVYIISCMDLNTFRIFPVLAWVSGTWFLYLGPENKCYFRKRNFLFHYKVISSNSRNL